MNETEKTEAGSRHAHIEVHVTNENNGKHEAFKEKRDTLVSVVIDQMYASSKLGIGRSREPEDRLRCKGDGGTDIFQFSSLKLEELQEKHCPSMHWKFAGPTGGA
jgi:hypothetical protein